MDYLCLQWQLDRVTLFPCPMGVTVTVRYLYSLTVTDWACITNWMEAERTPGHATVWPTDSYCLRDKINCDASGNGRKYWRMEPAFLHGFSVLVKKRGTWAQPGKRESFLFSICRMCPYYHYSCSQQLVTRGVTRAPWVHHLLLSGGHSPGTWKWQVGRQIGQRA